MAIFIKTKDPKELLGLIRSQIDNDIIKYWVYDLDGDITCIREELLGKAWLHPYLLDGFLAFGIMGRKNVQLSIDTYSIYHGKFVEILLNKLGSHYSSIIIKAPFENTLDTKNIENCYGYE